MASFQKWIILIATAIIITSVLSRLPQVSGLWPAVVQNFQLHLIVDIQQNKLVYHVTLHAWKEPEARYLCITVGRYY